MEAEARRIGGAVTGKSCWSTRPRRWLLRFTLPGVVMLVLREDGVITCETVHHCRYRTRTSSA